MLPLRELPISVLSQCGTNTSLCAKLAILIRAGGPGGEQEVAYEVDMSEDVSVVSSHNKLTFGMDLSAYHNMAPQALIDWLLV